MKFVLFYHSFTSCWNHGNAHFLRGVSRELARRGHEVVVFEPRLGWSRMNAMMDGGAAVLAECEHLARNVKIRSYELESLDLDRSLDGADVVIAHEWNETELIARLGKQRRSGGRFLLLFHDTHHRAVTAPRELDGFALDDYDAVLAFGEVLREVYLRRGWGRHVLTWHEAADTALFRPMPAREKNADLVWIGNWGDGERDNELQEFLLDPVRRSAIDARLYGVRYPASARARLRQHGIDYAGWLPNHRAPEVYSGARLTVHIPRRPYVKSLPGIPTIRVFEALACGIPLVSAPWDDVEGLFPDGSYLKVRDGQEMTAALRLLARDREFAAALARAGLRAIQQRHSCRHRVDELLAAVATLAADAHMQSPNGRRDRTRAVAS